MVSVLNAAMQNGGCLNDGGFFNQSKLFKVCVSKRTERRSFLDPHEMRLCVATLLGDHCHKRPSPFSGCGWMVLILVSSRPFDALCHVS